MNSIAKVVVEIALDREFDYRIPESLRDAVRLGSRVRVPFGSTEQIGYVVGFAATSSREKLKEIRALEGAKPVLGETILKLARWLSEYYCCPVEKAIRAVLPGAVRRRGAKIKERLFVSLLPAATPEAAAELKGKSPKQAAILDLLLVSGGGMFAGELTRNPGVTLAPVRSLERRGLISLYARAVGRDPFWDQVVLPTQPLNLMPEQASALALIKQAADTCNPPTVLLHGVTGSGKTEVYLQAIAYVLEQGKGAIVLVPEISLTPQTVERFRGRFGERIAVLHSSLSDGERHDEWYRIRDGQARIAIGARSAVFAPVKDLGLIVVDEEHEHSYKQEEVPRYNARDVAVMRGRMESCAVVLGSATPSLESYWNTRVSKYGIAVLSHRVDHRKMPVMRILDMRQEVASDGRISVFSRELVEAIRSRLDKGEQTILFLNRRGYATSLICPKCGYVAQCDRCSVCCTYHRHSDDLRCHICGARRRVPPACPGCGDRAYRFAGIGTQRVEIIVQKLFPHARVERMDADATTRKDSHRRILGDFRTGKTQILIGTQMVAKGLHFPNVTLIGVIYADLSLHMPDFRASERTFQLLTQVAGRAGRGDVPGEVIVQTYTPFHAAIQAARRLDFRGFSEEELRFRREFGYPPFSRLVCVTIRGPSEEKVSFSASVLARTLRKKLPSRVMVAGPAAAPLARAEGNYRYQIILRCPSIRAITGPLRQLLAESRWPAHVVCSADVDALSLI